MEVACVFDECDAAGRVDGDDTDAVLDGGVVVGSEFSVGLDDLVAVQAQEAAVVDDLGVEAYPSLAGLGSWSCPVRAYVPRRLVSCRRRRPASCCAEARSG